MADAKYDPVEDAILESPADAAKSKKRKEEAEKAEKAAAAKAAAAKPAAPVEPVAPPVTVKRYKVLETKVLSLTTGMGPVHAGTVVSLDGYHQEDLDRILRDCRTEELKD